VVATGHLLAVLADLAVAAPTQHVGSWYSISYLRLPSRRAT
jgi:hypothetical protein